MDFADVTRRHDICSFGTLLGGTLKPKKKKDKDEEESTGGNEIQEKQFSELFRATGTQEIELFQRSQYVWGTVQNGYKLSLMDNSSLWCQTADGGFSPIFVSGSGEIKKLSDEILPLGYAMGVCEDHARRLRVGAYSQKNASWRNVPATEKQISALKRLGIAFNPDISKGEATDLLNAKMSEPATDKQVWLIIKANLHPNPQFLTKYEAGKIIAEYKKRAG